LSFRWVINLDIETGMPEKWSTTPVLKFNPGFPEIDPLGGFGICIRRGPGPN